MKKIVFVTFLIITLTAVYGFAQMGGMMKSRSSQQSQDNPYGKGYYPCPKMMGPGMMGYGGYGMMGHGMMGHGMMGPGMGYGMGPGMMMGPGMGYGMGPGMMGRGMMGPGMGYGRGQGFDPETYQKYMDETAELRKNLHNKRFEYFEALRDPGTKPETIRNLEKEMRDMQWQLYEKAPK